MSKAKIAINGYGTIGKRVADAVTAQDDMEIAGVVKTRPSFEAKLANDRKFDLYAAFPDKIDSFNQAGLEVSGTLDDLLADVDLVVDCTPGGVGAAYKELYQKHGIKAIWQGGEDHEVAGFSFNSEANYSDAIGRDFTRVVSCNTTGLTRALYPLDQTFGIKKSRVTLMRRAADPGNIKSGPINAIIPNPISLPSHHGPDVNSILPHLKIATVAVKLSTTLMHFHALNVELNSDFEPQDIIDLYAARPRIRFVSGADKITSTAEVMELARDLGRSRSDMFENVIWKDSISKYQGELYFFQAIHQESDVVPENVDAIRAMCELESDGAKSIAKTNKTMGIGK
ncbi:MAG: type II glyceraldehyde-3-phosphate dehydrogenase [ANME-2 cluster archaeon]|nr:type II glyceraldehyde-3-phosphate dehydrogenase [ANME-2 cluster archaeon]